MSPIVGKVPKPASSILNLKSSIFNLKEFLTDRRPPPNFCLMFFFLSYRTWLLKIRNVHKFEYMASNEQKNVKKICIVNPRLLLQSKHLL